MTAVVEIMIAFLDLIEARAGSARDPLYKFSISLIVLAVAGLALVGGIGLLLAALLLGLGQIMPVHWAALITGAASLLVAKVLTWAGRSKSSE